MKDACMDCIRLTGIELWTHIGVPKEERAKPQRVLVDIEILHPTLTTGTSDDIKKGIDYAKITNIVVALAKTERKTIERLAEDIASAILAEEAPQGGVRVTVHKKPELPLSSVSITIQRP